MERTRPRVRPQRTFRWNGHRFVVVLLFDLLSFSVLDIYSVHIHRPGEGSSEKTRCWWLTFRRPEWKSSSESSWTECLPVHDVSQKSDPLKLIGQFCCDIIGYQTNHRHVCQHAVTDRSDIRSSFLFRRQQLKNNSCVRPLQPNQRAFPRKYKPQRKVSF